MFSVVADLNVLLLKHCCDKEFWKILRCLLSHSWSSVSDVLMDLPPDDNYRLSYTNVTLKVITIVICLCG